MQVFALVGPSGTGKSHHAQAVAYNEGIDTILDDGLLIHGSRIVAGFSAKREPTKLQAVRRAIFTDPQHVAAVRAKLEELDPPRLLVITTSDRMLERIRQRLRLPAPTRVIRIEDVATPKQMARALKARTLEGKHVVPVPTIEVKKNLPGILVDPLHYFFPRSGRGRALGRGEKSIVRPTFSYIGRLSIGEGAICSMARELLRGLPGLAKVLKITVESEKHELKLDLDVATEGFAPIPPVLVALQQRLKEGLEELTGLVVREVNVLARAVLLPSRQEEQTWEGQ
ncbi:MAG: Asp23/Gls24 family envelope stress response protein [Firmicutes bacterium]|nr:Asp23/Gls24 family envelope stress response protein [Bacillota bacterium]